MEHIAGRDHASDGSGRIDRVGVGGLGTDGQVRAARCDGHCFWHLHHPRCVRDCICKTTVALLAQNIGVSILFVIGAICLWVHTRGPVLEVAVIWVFSAFAALGFIPPLVTALTLGEGSIASESVAILSAINFIGMTILPVALAGLLLAIAVTDHWEHQRNVSRHDSLSGLLMRGPFEDDVYLAFRRADRQNMPIGLIVCDIDHFKRINDGWGHATGDMIITRVGKVIADMIRDTDVAGRIGGEEFCILVWNCALNPASSLAERLRGAVAEMSGEDASGNLQVTLSFGVAQRRAGETYQSLFERADASLYAAKRSGRDRVVADNAIVQKRGQRGLQVEVIPVHG